MPSGVAFRKNDIDVHLVEALCIETIAISPKAHAKTKNKFTAGEIYIASINAKGNYIVDTDGGAEKSLPPEEFLRIFKLVG